MTDHFRLTNTHPIKTYKFILRKREILDQSFFYDRQYSSFIFLLIIKTITNFSNAVGINYLLD